MWLESMSLNPDYSLPRVSIATSLEAGWKTTDNQTNMTWFTFEDTGSQTELHGDLQTIWLGFTR